MYLKEYRLTFFVSKFHQPGSSGLASTWLSRKNFLSATDHIFFGNEGTAHLHHAFILQHFETETQDWSWMKHKLTNLWNYIKLSFILDHSRVSSSNCSKEVTELKMHSFMICIENSDVERKLVFTSNTYKIQTIWPRMMKFWYKKRQSILFKRKPGRNSRSMASLSKSLTESGISGWWPGNVTN